MIKFDENKKNVKKKYHFVKIKMSYYKSIEEKIKKLKRKLQNNKIELIKYKGNTNWAINQEFIKNLYDEQNDLKERIENLENYSNKIKKRLEKKIDLIPDEKSTKVLELYYLNCLTFEDICDRLYISETTVRRWFSKGIYYIIEENEENN